MFPRHPALGGSWEKGRDGWWDMFFVMLWNLDQYKTLFTRQTWKWNQEEEWIINWSEKLNCYSYGDGEHIKRIYLLFTLKQICWRQLSDGEYEKDGGWRWLNWNETRPLGLLWINIDFHKDGDATRYPRTVVCKTISIWKDRDSTFSQYRLSDKKLTLTVSSEAPADVGCEIDVEAVQITHHLPLILNSPRFKFRTTVRAGAVVDPRHCVTSKWIWVSQRRKT